MSSRAILKVHEISKQPLDLSILFAAMDALPEPMAIAEDGKLIYSNPSFAQLPSEVTPPLAATDALNWRSTEFAAAGRTFSLTTRSRAPELDSSDSQHLAIIGRLVGGVAHDFNNLLTGILLYCDLLQTKVDTANPLWRRVQEIRNAAVHGATLVRQLMTIGREESSAPRAICFNRVVWELEPLLRHLLGENIRIIADLAEDSGLVGVSLAQAQQIILNLALNARDAMPRGGSLRLETRFREFEGVGRSTRIFEFAASDTGQGMDSQTATRIFDPFFTTKTPGRGTGMGLATVRRIVEDAGGIIGVDTGPGKGTRMTVRLPEVHRDQAASPAVRLSAPPEEPHSDSRGARL
jgi:two-component system cell cycle sensor histidine kinase/response regulator CckA